MSSTTLYRKYRPQTFADMVNQDHIKVTIQQEIKDGNLPHAFLFYGPRGIGKTTTARLLAKTLNCKSVKDSEPCNKCESCKSITNGSSLHLVEVDAASQTGVDNVRDNIIANARVAVSSDAYKVFIIDEVHMLSTSSFNALLKTLEEPPSRVLFILATTEIHKIPETIISRCQRFDFHPIKTADLFEYLKTLVGKEKREVEDAVLQSIAKKSGGHVRDAVSLLGQVLSLPGKVTQESAQLILPVSNIEHVITVFNNIALVQVKEAVQFVSEYEQMGGRILNFADELIEFAHNLMLFVTGANVEVFSGLVASEQEEEIKDIAKSFSPHRLMEVIDILMKRRQQLKDYDQGSIPLELAIIEMGKNPVNVSAPLVPPTPVAPSTPRPVPQRPAPVAPMPTPAPKPTVSTPPAKPKPVAEEKVEEPEITAGDLASYAEVRSAWKSIMLKLNENYHSLFIALKAGELRENNGQPEIAFRYQMHQGYIKTNLHKLIEQCKECIPGKAFNFEVVVDQTLEAPTGGDVEEVDEEEKEEISAELNRLVDAFGGTVIE